MSIKVNDKTIFTDVKPYIENNRTMIPVRFVVENLGAEINWDDTSKQITIKDQNNVLKLKIGGSEATCNNKTFALDAKAVIKDSRTMIPLRFVSEGMGAEVNWDEATKTVSIRKGLSPSSTPLAIPSATPSHGTGANIEEAENPNEVDFYIQIDAIFPLEPQYTEVQAYLKTKVGGKLASEILTYVKQKKLNREELPEKFFQWGEKKIQVISTKGERITIAGGLRR